MIKHPIRRFLGLTVLYSLIILGIFLIQFRSETALSQTFSGLRLQLVETQSNVELGSLQNVFQSTYRGLSLFADQENPVVITTIEGNQVPLTLYNWQKTDSNNFTLFFEQGITLQFTVGKDKSSDFLSIEAKLPENVENIFVPYKPMSGYLVTEQGEKRMVLSSKTQQYEVSAAEITPTYLVMSPQEQRTIYRTFESLQSFEFSMAASLPLSTETTFNETVTKFKDDFIQLASQSLSDTSTEQLVIAYIAAMAENHQYREAIRQIPNSIKTGNKRTYLSAPYFNSLLSMNASLVRHIENRVSMIDYAISQGSIDIFTIQDLAQVLCTMEGNSKVEELLSIPSTLTDFAPTVTQAAGIINTYVRLFSLNKAFAEILQPVLPACFTVISRACAVENGEIRLVENDTALSLIDSIFVGMSLIAHGELTENIDHKATGYLIVNSYLHQEVSSNLHVMTELYPIIVPKNPYYPHIRIIANASSSGNDKPIWAWTVARNSSYTKQANGDVLLTLDFPLGETHYAIVNGIRPFTRIDIYNVQFRTDANFEAYNSSGYVYRAESQTLFLKSLHESQAEQIKLYYTSIPEEVRPAPVSPPKPAIQEPVTPTPPVPPASTTPEETPQEDKTPQTPPNLFHFGQTN